MRPQDQAHNLQLWPNKLSCATYVTETRDQGPGTRDQGSGTRDQGPGTRDQGALCHSLPPSSILLALLLEVLPYQANFHLALSGFLVYRVCASFALWFPFGLACTCNSFRKLKIPVSHPLCIRHRLDQGWAMHILISSGSHRCWGPE